MRKKADEVIEAACEKLALKHESHIEIYGAHNEERLTGLHELAVLKNLDTELVIVELQFESYANSK